MGFTIWRKRDDIERDNEAECGHRCFYMESGKKTAFCDVYSSDNSGSLRNQVEADGIKACLELNRFGPIEIGKGKDKKLFYKCSL